MMEGFIDTCIYTCFHLNISKVIYYCWKFKTWNCFLSLLWPELSLLLFDGSAYLVTNLNSV